MKAKVFIAIVAFMAAGSMASAQNTPTNQPKNQNENRRGCYVDVNKNNLCDNFENKTCKRVNARGVCDGSGRVSGLRNGAGRQKGNGKALAQGRRDGSGKGQGGNYKDVNKNGICDYRENRK